MNTRRLRITLVATLVTLIAMGLLAQPILADTSKISKGAIIGGAAGLIFGHGLTGTLQGATIGAGVGAATSPGQTGVAARDSARTGAYIGAGIGVITGKGLGGALQGGLYGGSAGAIYGGLKNK